jgi:hypothetical protein
MGFIPVQPQRTRELRERYRKARRRQQALLLLGGCGLALVIGIISLTVFLVRRPPTGAKPVRETQSGAKHHTSRKLAKVKPVRSVGSFALDPAPWKLELDSDNLYCFADTQNRQPLGDAYYNCDLFQARPLGGGKPRWEVKAEIEVGQVEFASGAIVTLKPELADKLLILTGYSSKDGHQLWQTRVEGAVDGDIHANGKEITLACGMSDGYRLVGYSGASGGKLWGVKLPLRHLTKAAHDPVHLERYDTPSAAVYVHGSVIGIVDLVKHKLRREYQASGPIVSVSVEEQTKTAYILVGANQAGSYSVTAISIDSGKAQEVQRILGAQSAVTVVPGPQWLLSGYQRLEDGVPQLVLSCKLLGRSGGKTYDAPLGSGELVCGAVVPGAPGSFLVGIGASASSGQLAGARQFYIVTPAASSVTEAGRTPQDALWLFSFKDNLLAVCDGGVLHRYDLGGLRFRQLCKLRYPQLQLMQSDDRTTLLAVGTTDKWFKNEPGQPMQAVVIQ